MNAPGAPDENRHPPGDAAGWTETWSFDFWSAEGLGGFVRLSLLPSLGVAWYWAGLVRPEEGPVLVRDHEVPPPRGDDLLVKSDGLWAEIVCEDPLEFWTVGLEAYGVRFDDPADAYRGEIGERLAVGFDIEWEASMPAREFGGRPGYGSGYGQVGAVDGEILLGSERFELDGAGAREHCWGPLEWWSAPWHRAAFCVGELLAVGVWQGGRQEATDGYVWRLGEETAAISDLRVETHPGPEGIPVAARYVVGHELEVDVEVLSALPLLLEGPDGRRARLPRALCRYTVEGENGLGWGEWLQPGGAS